MNPRQQLGNIFKMPKRSREWALEAGDNLMLQEWRGLWGVWRRFIGLPPTGSGNHRADGPGTGHALTFKVDHSNGADHYPRKLTFPLV